MKSSVKLGKHVEDQRGKGCLDRISSLPNELLGQVLSLLPTMCAVRTSILSKKWRYVFALTSCVSFDDESCFGGLTGHRHFDKARKRSFKKYVSNVLEKHQISVIKKFSLVCGDVYDRSDLTAWVSNAVQYGTQEIHYEVARMVEVPDGLVMSETLAVLKIISDGVNDIEIPLSVWLPNLKILHLNYVRFVDCDSMQRLFSCCKLLEELTLDRCECFGLDMADHVIISSGSLNVLTIEDCTFEDGLFEIDAPNLAYLTYNCNTGVKIVPSWKKSCSLVKAELMFHYLAEISVYSSLEYDREVIKAAASNLTELRLLSDSVEVLLTLVDPVQMPEFHCLSRLHLGSFPYDSWKFVTNLLDKSPQLKTVIFEWGLHRCFCDPPSPLCEPLSPFSCNAQVIELRNFCYHKGSLLFLGHLLENARDLKKLIIHKCSSNSFGTELQMSKDDLLTLPRASRDCCIELK